MNATHYLRAPSPETLELFEAHNLAYVKRIVLEGRAVYAIHAADGTPIGLAPDREVAFAALRQQDLEPVSVN
jgi:hypothetical protein